MLITRNDHVGPDRERTFEDTVVGLTPPGSHGAAAAPASRFGALRAAGDRLSIGGRTFRVAEVITLDGTKVVCWRTAGGSRPPVGTEPVVRPYVETFAPPAASADARAEARAWQDRIMAWLRAEISALVG